MLVTSEGPLGNIGMPGAIEDVRHFHEMLARTATRITPEEREQLEKSLLLVK